MKITLQIRYASRVRLLAIETRAVVACVLCVCAFFPTHAATMQPVSGEPGSSIVWDTWGVPHIFAESEEEALFAYGWCQVEAHGTLLKKLFLAARGTAAATFGEAYLKSDQAVVHMNVAGITELWWREQSPQARVLVSAFTRGLNAGFAKQASAARGEAFRVSEGDVLARVICTLHLGFGVDAGLMASRALGSNAWAIAPQNTSSGAAMLLGAPHLPWDERYRWFEAHIIAPGFDFYGFGFVGFPVFGFGFNQDLGWTHTVNGAPRIDRLDGTIMAGEFRSAVGASPVARREASIAVLGRPPVSYGVDETKFGPIIAKDGDRIVVAVVRGMQRTGVLSQYFNMMRAHSLEQFERALVDLQCPLFNTIMAGRSGDILYVCSGSAPKPQTEADASRNDVPQWYSYAEIPRQLNPKGGWLQSANDPPWFAAEDPLDPKSYPPAFNTGAVTMRSRNSRATLSGKRKWGIEDAKLAFASTHSPIADRLVPLALEVTKDAPELARAAAKALGGWDRQFEPSSKGAYLFLLWLQALRVRNPDEVVVPERALTALVEVASQMQRDGLPLETNWGARFVIGDGTQRLPSRGAGNITGMLNVVDHAKGTDQLFHATGGDTCTLIVSFASQPEAFGRLNYGNSSERGARHNGDQFQLLSEGKYREIWWKKEDIERNVERREVLGISSTLSSGR